MSGKYDERGPHYVQMVASVASSTTNQTTDVVNAGMCNWVQFIINFGLLNGNATIYVYESENTTASGDATANWTYRKTSAVNTDAMGDITAGSASGITVTDNTDDGKVYIIDIDPAQLSADHNYVFVTVDPGTDALVSVTAALYPRYPQNTNISCVV